MTTLIERAVEELNKVARANSYFKKLQQEKPNTNFRIHLSDAKLPDDDIPHREKERLRKDTKATHPNTSLKWNQATKKWKVRAREKDNLDKRIQPITELSFRTGAIAVYLAKVKQFAGATDKGISQLKSLASQLQNAKTDEIRNKIHGEIVRVDADVLLALRRMEMYSSLVSAAGGLGADRSYKLLQKIQKTKRH